MWIAVHQPVLADKAFPFVNDGSLLLVGETPPGERSSAQMLLNPRRQQHVVNGIPDIGQKLRVASATRAE